VPTERATHPGRSAGAGPHTVTRFPPFGHDGTERRIERPQDPAEQTRCRSIYRRL
jgi:hypothetical protein